MCLAKIYLLNEEKKPLMENITSITLDGKRVQVETLFGEKKVFQGKIVSINFTDSRVSLDLDKN